MGHVLVFGGVGSSFSTTPSLSHYSRFLRVALFIIDDSFSLVISPRLNQKMISSRQDESAPLSTTPSLSLALLVACASLSLSSTTPSLWFSSTESVGASLDDYSSLWLSSTPPRLGLIHFHLSNTRTTLRIKRHENSAKTRIKRHFGGVKEYTCETDRVNAIGVMVMNALDVMTSPSSLAFHLLRFILLLAFSSFKNLGEDSVHVSSSEVPLFGTLRSQDPHFGSIVTGSKGVESVSCQYSCSLLICVVVTGVCCTHVSVL
ncbi:hypothetical protein F2Q70_00044030 [Brassica cretica]|uniref:Uncharacterized protein n=1 Tax=Brassica cretica TaxID=69181 RepID=A0A8S9KIQ5_BRACR|nr:hypothetical protein F2Q70_00044030 [Brassica cretica]